MSEPRWHIGKESSLLDRAPYRAYFYWVENNVLVDSADFDLPGLDAEIERRRSNGQDVTQFETAREKLVLANS